MDPSRNCDRRCSCPRTNNSLARSAGEPRNGAAIDRPTISALLPARPDPFPAGLLEPASVNWTQTVRTLSPECGGVGLPTFGPSSADGTPKGKRRPLRCMWPRQDEATHSRYRLGNQPTRTVFTMEARHARFAQRRIRDGACCIPGQLDCAITFQPRADGDPLPCRDLGLGSLCAR